MFNKHIYIYLLYYIKTMNNKNIIKNILKHPRLYYTTFEIANSKLSGDVDFSFLKQLTEINTLIILHNDHITSISGLPDSIQKLDCTHNDKITYLNELPSNLKILICHHSIIENINNLPSSLKILDCRINPLIKSLDNLPNGLVFLNCSDCMISRLDNLPESLEVLNCSRNLITDLSNLPAGLKILICQFNPLVNLNNLPASLTYLSCSNCKLESVVLPNSLLKLEMENCDLTEVPKLHDGIKYCDVSNNLISVVDAEQLPKSIETFSCYDNNIEQITNLDIKMANIIYNGDSGDIKLILKSGVEYSNDDDGDPNITEYQNSSLDICNIFSMYEKNVILYND